MQEGQLHALIEHVRAGRLSRRMFIERMMALGLTAPLAGQMLMHSGVVQAQTPSAYKPTKRGGGGALRLLWWQAPTLLNPHFGTGEKDLDGARIFYEPLATWAGDGTLVPVLADGIPSLDNGDVANDGRSVTWRLKHGVQWHDGRPFTADDCVFNWEYARNPETSAVTLGTYRDVTVVKVDDLTVRVEFKQPTPFWAGAFVNTGVIPKHLFADFVGTRSREAPANLRPVGTGPYRFVSFKPGDELRGELNPNYHLPNRPFFDTIEMKGGGDAVSAARAVIQTGEFDFAWNTQVEDEVLRRMESGGRGRAVITAGGVTEFILLNQADPWSEVDGERASPKSRHPILTDPVVRQAINHLVDRKSIQEHIYGRTGVVTANFLNNPEHFNSKNVPWEFSIDRANAVLDAAGWSRASDGGRAKDGRRLKFLFQTSINALRQKSQTIIKQAAQRAGVELELKAITPSIYFSSDVANPETNTKFFADIQMFALSRTNPDPGRFMELFCSWEMASRENKWQGRNLARWRSDDYDKAFRSAQTELDPVKRAALFIRMNDLVCSSNAVIPIVYRPDVSAVSNRLHAPLSGWSSNLWRLHDWYRDA